MIKPYVNICVLLVLLSACASIKYTKIEVLVPSEVAYPPSIQKVVLVNNAAKQPADIGHDTYLNELYKRKPSMRLVDTDTVELDSLGFSCLYNTANNMVEQDFFKEIHVHPYKLNARKGYNIDGKLSRQRVDKLLEQYDADAVISLDRLQYGSKLIIREYMRGYYDDPTMDVNYSLTWRVYYPERHKKAQRVTIKDTLYWTSTMEGDYLKVIPRKDAVSEAIWAAGEGSAKKLVPYWLEVDRLYYSKGNTYFKLANRHYQEGEWKEAADIWEYLYLTQRKLNKARAAVNLAYISELSGDLPLAMEWIMKAKAAYRETAYFSYSAEYNMIESYRKVLKNRLRDEVKLSKQFDVVH